MRVEHFIAELLYRYNCVVVPEFGAFLANSISARIDDKLHTLYPPTKQLSFNQQLSKNDGLLVSHIANIVDMPFEEVLNQVTVVAKIWKDKLDNGNSVFLEGIGKLWMGKEQKIQFQPEQGYNYLVSSFGLSAFDANPILREELKNQVEELEDKVPFTITPEAREGRKDRPWLKYAAVFLLLLATGTGAYQLYNQGQQRQIIAQQQAQDEVARYIQQATFFEASPLELPALNLNITEKKKVVGPLHHIIAGAFRFEKNASKKVAQLKAQGYSSASYLGQNRNGLHQVAFASFSNSREALKFLQEVKRNVSKDAWMLSKR